MSTNNERIAYHNQLIDQAQAMVDALPEAGNGGTISDEQIAAAVENYFSENPIETEDGASAYDIWLEAGNTGTEADFLESLKGKPGVSGVYVGGDPIPDGYNVQIDPDGEADALAYLEGTYELIETVTFDEAAVFYRSEEPDGTPYNFKRITVKIKAVDTVTACQWTAECDGTNVAVLYVGGLAIGSYSAITGAVNYFQDHGYWSGAVDTFRSALPSYNARQYIGFSHQLNKKVSSFPTITAIHNKSAQGVTYPAGTVFEIWGVRADA